MSANSEVMQVEIVTKVAGAVYVYVHRYGKPPLFVPGTTNDYSAIFPGSRARLLKRARQMQELIIAGWTP